MEGGQEAGPHQASSGVRKDRLSISLFPRTRGAHGRILSERKESPESHSGIAALALLWAQGRRKRGCQKQRNGLEGGGGLGRVTAGGGLPDAQKKGGGEGDLPPPG